MALESRICGVDGTEHCGQLIQGDGGKKQQ